MYLYIYTVNPEKVVQTKYTIIHIYRSRGYCNICVNTKILSCVLIARSISVEIKTCCSIYCTQCRDHVRRMICVAEWFIKDYFIKGGVKK